MPAVDAKAFTDDDLISFDKMMVECVALTGIGMLKSNSSLADVFWGEVLRELGRRKLAQLISGSYDDIAHALVTRSW